MAIIVPPGVPGDGTTLVYFVPTIANQSAPKLTETSAAGALDITCYLSKDFGVEGDQETGEDERLCLVQTLETPGSAKYNLTDLTLVADPQTPTSVSNKAVKTLVPGLSGFLLIRYGKNVETALAVGDIVDVIPITCGIQTKMPPEKNKLLRQKQKLFVTGNIQFDKAMVA